jgi:hypothetical protein
LSEFVDGSLSEVFSTDNNDITKVGDGGNDSGSELDLLEGFINLEDIVASAVFAFNIFLHVVINLGSSEMDLNHF